MTAADWVTGVLGLLGLLGALWSIHASRTSNRIAEKSREVASEALEEVRRTPVRAAQHEHLRTLTDQASQLEHLTERLNRHIQEAHEGPLLEQDATELLELSQQMTAPVIIDEELAAQLSALREIIQPNADEGYPVRLRFLAQLVDEIKRAKEAPGDSAGSRDKLLELGRSRGHSQEPLRMTNHGVLEIARAIRARLRELEATGLGDLSQGTTEVDEGQ